MIVGNYQLEEGRWFSMKVRESHAVRIWNTICFGWEEVFKDKTSHVGLWRPMKFGKDR